MVRSATAPVAAPAAQRWRCATVAIFESRELTRANGAVPPPLIVLKATSAPSPQSKSSFHLQRFLILELRKGFDRTVRGPEQHTVDSKHNAVTIWTRERTDENDITWLDLDIVRNDSQCGLEGSKKSSNVVEL